jgi:hypothetical protein
MYVYKVPKQKIMKEKIEAVSGNGKDIIRRTKFLSTDGFSMGQPAGWRYMKVGSEEGISR